MKKFYFVLGLMAMICMVSAGLLQGADLYVGDPSKSPNYATIQAAINAATNAGDTIIVADGIYNENLIINKAGLVLKAIGNVVISKEGVPGVNNLGIVNITSPDVIFDGFEVRTETFPGSVRGIDIYGADRVVIRNCKVHHISDVLIYPCNSDNLLVENCDIYDTWDFAVKPSSSQRGQLHRNCDWVTIRNCRIYLSNGIWVYSGAGWTIENCVISGWQNWSSGWLYPYQNAQLGIALDSGGGHIVRNNLIYAVTEAGIKIESNSCTIVNNTIAFCYDWKSEAPPFLLQAKVSETPSDKNGFGIRFKAVSNAIVKNNILAYNYRGIGIYPGYSGPNPANSTIEYNDVYGGDVAGLAALGYTIGSDWDYDTTKGFAVGFNWDPALTSINSLWQPESAGNLSLDPKFACLYPPNYSLKANSPCIDAGTNSGAPLTDIQGFLRPVDGDINGDAVTDMGAYESQVLNVDFDSQGGSSVTSQSVAYGSLVTKPDPGPTKTGYTFGGWYEESVCTNAWNFDSDTMGAADMTLFAKWTAVTYAVSYSGNGNTGGSAPADQTKTHAVDLTLQTNTGALAKTGYTFAGWNTAAAGTGTDYAVSASYTTNATLALYAKWTAVPYAVSYSGNGNTGGSAPVDSSSPYNYNATVTVLGAGTLTKTGYTFAGWNTAADGTGTSYAAAGTFPMPAAAVTLYAKWPVYSLADFTIEEAKIDWKRKADDDKIRVIGTFTIPSNNIDVGDLITVIVGKFTQSPIPMDAKGKKDQTWEFKRDKGETGIKDMKLEFKKNEIKFEIHIDKEELGLMSDWGDPNHLLVSLQIGDDIGTADVKMKVDKNKDTWEYKNTKR